MKVRFMNKKFFFASLLVAMALQAQAIRPVKKAWPMAQSDGTTVTVYVHGHSGVDFYTTMDKKILLANEQGDLCYALIENGKLVPSAYIAHEANVRSAEEKAFLEENNVADKLSEMRKIAIRGRHKMSHKVISASTEDGLGRYQQSGMGALNSIGQANIPVIMVEFSDATFKEGNTIEKMQRYYTEKGYKDEANCKGSVRDYFLSQSRGMFDPNFKVVAKVNVGKPYKTYGRNVNGNDVAVEDLVRDAVKAAIAQNVDFNEFKDAQGNIQLVTVLYAGKGEATSSNQADLVWPCQFDFNSWENIEGFHFNGAFVGNEQDNDGSLMGMGVFCHELGHALGLPDWYCTLAYGYSGDDAFGNWSIMDTGAYVYDGNAPIGYTAYERSYFGWLNIPELKDTTFVTLTSPERLDGEMAVLIRNPNSSKEYFILENRHPGTWYPKIEGYGRNTYGSGLMLTHVTYDKDAWKTNTPNNEQYAKRAYIITADKQKLDYSASESNLYGNGVNEIISLPLYDGASLSTTPIYNIKKHTDGTITFHYLTPTAIQNVVTEDVKGNDLYYDLQGRRIKNPIRGIYIKNGKKVIVK
ncbi:M6 family metalloprotease domain-containing protein [Prevotella sp. HUN102]|uniref:M6 family metalloprotease domain-containing protein n=1 Tax=Prevotella sp. HUN102 TaxID=1392486 RepID=UPI001E433CF5|nr:M6 family metalloprotease domain-containing protein [Prevotella sp. HUN102]